MLPTCQDAWADTVARDPKRCEPLAFLLGGSVEVGSFRKLLFPHTRGLRSLL